VIFSRRRLALALPLSGLALSCKRQRAPKVTEVWDEQPAVEHTEALASLAPPWPAPVRARLDSGLLGFWLAEEGTPAAHVRVLLPTHTDGHVVSADRVSVVGEYLRFELQRRTAREGTRIELGYGPDRIELSLHGRDEDLGALLKWLGWVLRPEPPIAGLERARERVVDRIGEPNTQEIALAALTARLLGREAADQRIDAAGLRARDRDDLSDAWSELTDPRRAVLVVHAGRTADAARTELRRLSDAWHGLGKAKVQEEAIGRLRPAVKKSDGKGRLLAEPAEPLELVAGGRGSPHLVLGRVVPTPTAEDRSLARLAQRILQEEIDARLVLAGSHAMFVASDRLSPAAPDQSATDLVDDLSRSAKARHPSQRLFQAAELWLGARIVQASLSGEDWTALFAESIDLADRDAEISEALARDAATMLEPDPEALRTWMERWLHPRAGEPGWRWVAAGVDRRLERRLERIVPIVAR
jgi:hypothetical protein